MLFCHTVACCITRLPVVFIRCAKQVKRQQTQRQRFSINKTRLTENRFALFWKHQKAALEDLLRGGFTPILFHCRSAFYVLSHS